MNILAIDTSCDDTSAAVVKDNVVLSNVISSQTQLHKEWGGVVPIIAKRAHQERIDAVISKALQLGKVPLHAIDVIAITYGPGLAIVLEVGVKKAKELAIQLHKPLIAVNHMEGHLYSTFAQTRGKKSIEPQFPLLSLLVSGNHTELVLMKEWLEYELVGQTLDDAVGEAFDKVARMLSLPYPGGPEISRLAELVRENPSQETTPAYVLPRPMINDATCNFSFSGLKTAVLYLLKKNPEITEHEKKHLAHEFENAVTEVLWKKTARALDETGAQALALGGGVSANTHIRRTFAANMKNEYPNVALRIPASSLTTDNAIMIAMAGFYRVRREESPNDIIANGNRSLA